MSDFFEFAFEYFLDLMGLVMALVIVLIGYVFWRIIENILTSKRVNPVRWAILEWYDSRTHRTRSIIIGTIHTAWYIGLGSLFIWIATI